jgi:uncharacterized membrane protein
MVVEGGMKASTVLTEIAVMHFIAPALLSYAFVLVLRKIGWVRPGDMKLMRDV